jgi:tetratricopeptide (TPR) repeat protein
MLTYFTEASFAKRVALLSFLVASNSLTNASSEPEPTDARTFVEKGNQWYKLKEWNKAIKEYDGAINLDPKDVEALFNRGCCLAQIGKLGKALPDFTEAIKLEPKYAPSYYCRGNVRVLIGDIGELDKAIADLTKAIQLDQQYYLAFAVRASAFRIKGRYDKAMEDLNEAIRLDSNKSLAYRFRGIVHLRCQDYDKALEDLDKAIRIDPKDADAYFDRIDYHLTMGHLNAALQDAEVVIQFNPKSATAMFHRGLVWQKRFEWENSIKDFDEAIRLDSEYVKAYALRAIVRATCSDLKFRDADKAYEDAKRACDLSLWKSTFALAAYAAACAAKGDFAEAVKWQKKVVEDADFVNMQSGVPKFWLKLFEEKKPAYIGKPKVID